MAAVSYISPRFQAINELGKPLVGGLLYTYANETTMPHVTYSDEAQTSANTNPIVLNLRGEAVIWLDEEQIYTFVLRNSNGELIWSQDGIAGSSYASNQLKEELAEPSGSSLIGYKQAGITASNRTIQDKLRDSISVKDYGAKGDYETDDTVSIRAAIDACVPGSVLWFPRGVYKCTDGITIPKGVSVNGVGSPSLGTFPDRYGNKAFLRPHYKHQMPGASLIFSGTGSATATTVRSAPFNSFKYAVQIIGDIGPARWNGVGIIQDMDIFDAAGNLTPYGTHNPAIYDVGLFVNNSVHGDISASIFGYWNVAGVINYGSNPDQNTFKSGSSSGQRGFVNLGTGAAGLSGTNWIDWDMYSAEYHLRNAAYVGICALQIDGGGFNINGHYMHGGRINTYAVTPVILNSVREAYFYGVVMETTFIPPDQTSAAVKIISENGQVDRVGFIGCRWTNNPVYGPDRLSGQASGAIFFVGGPPGVNPNSLVEVCYGSKVAKIIANSSAYDLQLGGDTSSSNSGIVIRNNGDNTLRFIANNSTIGTLDPTGIFNAPVEASNRKRLVRASAVIIGTSINFTRTWSIVTTGTGSGGTLNNINDGVQGDEILITPGLSAEPITVSSTGGNIRAGADVVVNGFNSLRLIFNGNFWTRAA